MRQTVGWSAIAVVVLGFAALVVAAIIEAGGPPCKPFVTWDRYPGSQSSVQEFVKRDVTFETVTLYLCSDGTVRGSVD